MCGYMCAAAHFMHNIIKIYKVLHACFLLHMDLSCTLVQLITSSTLDMYHTSKLITSAYSINCQTHMTHHMKMLLQMHVLPLNACAPEMHQMSALFWSNSWDGKFWLDLLQ